MVLADSYAGYFPEKTEGPILQGAFFGRIGRLKVEEMGKERKRQTVPGQKSGFPASFPRPHSLACLFDRYSICERQKYLMMGLQTSHEWK